MPPQAELQAWIGEALALAQAQQGGPAAPGGAAQQSPAQLLEAGCAARGGVAGPAYATYLGQGYAIP